MFFKISPTLSFQNPIIYMKSTKLPWGQYLKRIQKHKTCFYHKWGFRILDSLSNFLTRRRAEYAMFEHFNNRGTRVFGSRMMRRWWSAISPQLGRSALDIPPSSCLLTCPLISSSYMCFTLSLRDASRPILLPLSSSWLSPSNVHHSSLFLASQLDVLRYVWSPSILVSYLSCVLSFSLSHLLCGLLSSALIDLSSTCPWES